MYEKFPPHFNTVRTLPCENKTSHFILLCTLRTTPVALSMMLSMKFIRYRENKLIVPTYVQNVRLWLKHKLASMLAIGQLYHQSATAPCCTTQLRNVCGLPLPVRRSSKPVSCTFLDKFVYSSSFPVLIRKFLNQSPSTVTF